MGLVPVLYGDAVLDTKLGFTILSGDQLITALAMKFSSKRIIIGVDVNGIYDADPKTEKNAKIFTHLTLKELKELQNKFGKPSSCDVTGGMQGKMSELIPAVEAGIVVIIVDATKPNNVYKALKGEKVEGTTIKKE
jgi:isopentenyl phosphate kinase